MASVTITQIQLIQGKSTVPGKPMGLYWNTDSSSTIDVDPTKIVSVAYAWDSTVSKYVPGAIQVSLVNALTFFSSDSYASVAALIP
jgi:hypothetical protein